MSWTNSKQHINKRKQLYYVFSLLSGRLFLFFYCATKARKRRNYLQLYVSACKPYSRANMQCNRRIMVGQRAGCTLIKTRTSHQPDQSAHQEKPDINQCIGKLINLFYYTNAYLNSRGIMIQREFSIRFWNLYIIFFKNSFVIVNDSDFEHL